MVRTLYIFAETRLAVTVVHFTKINDHDFTIIPDQ